jgi:hypothetical protein
MGGFIIISDRFTDGEKGGPIYHHRGCRAVTLANFTEKVFEPLTRGERPNGEYHWVATTRAAEAGGARACELPDDPLGS